ncbi:MAG: TonB-dependent receptor, partial [Calditrichaeota bacterium]
AVVNITTKSGATRYTGGLEVVGSGLGSDPPAYLSALRNPDMLALHTQLAGTLDPAQVARNASQYGDGTTLALDDYGYRQITGWLGGPIPFLPGKKFGFFGSVEFVDTNDDDPRASGLEIPSAGIKQNFLPDNESQVLRYTGKIDARLFGGKLKLIASSSGSFRKARQYVHSYAKFNSFHNPRVKEDVISGSLRLSHIIDETTFWDLTLRGKDTKWQRGDGFWNENIFAYGDFDANLEKQGIKITGGDRSKGIDPVTGLALGNGGRVERPVPGVFHGFGRVFNDFTKYRITTLGADLNFTKQFKNHLLEVGGMVEQSEVRYWTIAPLSLALFKDTRPLEERYFAASQFFFGYNLEGEEIEEDNFRTVSGDRFLEAAPPRPVTAAAYIQDKIEFQDFILNVGLRWDFFDPDYIRIKDPFNVLGFGNPTTLDEEDFEPMPTESYVSPRVGFAFPVTEFTVFHAQYGIFRQEPRLFDLYDSWINLDDLEFIDGQGQNNGHLKAETTTQYEFGFKQQFGNQASLDITAYYKNVKGLTNVTTLTSKRGNTTFQYITTINADFGTVKGLAFSFNLRRLGPLSMKLDYTLSLAEGTGSSQSSSFIATFRNPNNETPKVIAPLSFDQRHTLTTSIDIRAGRGEGPMIFGTRLLENAGVNFLVTFNSGRPYTPIASQNLLAGASLYGPVTQTINSAYARGIFRVDMKLEKTFQFG